VNQSRLQSLQRKLYGVCTAIVESVDDPDHEGRVTLRFPWLDDSTVSDWCRVSQLYAGNGYGSLFVPEAKDEVLVAFVHGEMAEPIVLGGLYNGHDKPATYHDSKANKDQKLIRTKAGHQILLDDGSQSKQVEIKTAGGHVAGLDDQNKLVRVKSAGGHELVLDDSARTIKLTSSVGASIEIDSAGKITIKGTSEVALEAPKISLTATASVSVSAPQVSLG
jgi:uncharacterized protein involved in type VI secretion and phage assembly